MIKRKRNDENLTILFECTIFVNDLMNSRKYHEYKITKINLTLQFIIFLGYFCHSCAIFLKVNVHNNDPIQHYIN